MNIQYLFVLGDNLKRCQTFLDFFAKLHDKIVRVLPSETYKSGSFLQEDGRKRSDDLLKDMFPVAKEDIIGTPKFYIIRPNTGELLFHGLRSFNNPYPDDIVRYFYKAAK